MSIHFKCPKCGATVYAPDTAAGKKGVCPKCKTAMEVPSPSTPTTSAKGQTENSAAEKPPVPARKDVIAPRVPAQAPEPKSRSKSLAMGLGVAVVLVLAAAAAVLRPWDRTGNQQANGVSDRDNRPEGNVSRASDKALFLVKENGKWGYIDRSGTVVIEPQYPVAADFHEGLARVKVSETGDDGYINSRGDLVITAVPERCSHFNDGMARIEEDRKYGFIDTKGEAVIPLQFDRAGIFQEGLCHVLKNGEWVFIDKTGSVVLRPSAHVPVTPTVFQEGLILVTVDGKTGYNG